MPTSKWYLAPGRISMICARIHSYSAGGRTRTKIPSANQENFSMLITEFPSSFCQPLPQMILKSDIIRSQISFLCYILLLASPLLLEGLHALQSGANTTHCARQSEIQDSFPIENVPQLLFPEINLTEALFEVW